MLNSIIGLPLFIASLSAGLMAGVYFAFSTFIMRSFDQMGAVQAVDAMNSVNRVIQRSWFMTLFFGSTLLYAVLAGYAVFAADLPARWWLFAAGLIYLVGMFLCTIVFNVRLNDSLAAIGTDESIRIEAWQHYVVHWTRWNHVRIQYLVSHAWVL